MPSKPNNPCHCCAGSGQESDDLKTGRALSGLRLRLGVTLRQLAKAMGISHSYLCQLEKGQRRWSLELEHRYRSGLRKLMYD